MPKAASITRSTSGSAAGSWRASYTRTRRSALAQPLGGDTSVGTVVAGPGEHGHRAPVGTAEHLERRPGHGGTGALDQHLDRFGGGGIDRPHLAGVTIGITAAHRYSATT